jgi:DNA-binding CsgD family transcriptional regulator
MDALNRGRQAYADQAWDAAWHALTEADRTDPLWPEDLERMAWCAALTAREAEFLATFERVHAGWLACEEPARAARAAFWLGLRLMALGQGARGSGWFARCERLVRDLPCVEQGYATLPAVVRALGAGDLGAARAAAERVVAIGQQFGEADLVAFGQSFLGRAMVRVGDVDPGLRLLDEAMVAVTAGELSPMMTGIVYCAVIATCQAVYAHDRSREWTAALGAWCDAQPEAALFHGICRVHRSELLVLSGAWAGALDEARQASEQLSLGADPSALAEAYYQRGEVHRLRGALASAEEAYAAAHRAGGEPQPGLALLRLAQGRPDAARAALRRVLDATTDPLRRTRHLPASIEVLLAAGEIEDAVEACAELQGIAARFATEVLVAEAATACGTVALARGEAASAVGPLRSAITTWQRVGAPYRAARARVVLGRACAALGDPDGAALEIDAARTTFADLGARTDLTQLETLADGAPPDPGFGLTPRELEVLREVARGRTNRAIARRLQVSDRTIDRHVSNILGKLGLPTRAAATAWAYEHDLVPRGPTGRG